MSVFRFLNKNRHLFRKLAPRAGFEPATYRLTVECSTAELPGIICAAEVRLLIQMLFRFAKRFFKKNDGRRLPPCGEGTNCGVIGTKEE